MIARWYPTVAEMFNGKQKDGMEQVDTNVQISRPSLGPKLPISRVPIC